MMQVSFTYARTATVSLAAKATCICSNERQSAQPSEALNRGVIWGCTAFLWLGHCRQQPVEPF